ncbi:MAG: acyl transferase, partial [Chitinophagaceae bacterium]
TEDLGRWQADGTFEILGRMDNTDIRGCSQLAL